MEAATEGSGEGQLHPRALILGHVLGYMLIESCRGVQLHRSSSSLEGLPGMAGKTQALP